jgi:hypothetical protein
LEEDEGKRSRIYMCVSVWTVVVCSWPKFPSVRGEADTMKKGARLAGGSVTGSEGRAGERAPVGGMREGQGAGVHARAKSCEGLPLDFFPKAKMGYSPTLLNLRPFQPFPFWVHSHTRERERTEWRALKAESPFARCHCVMVAAPKGMQGACSITLNPLSPPLLLPPATGSGVGRRKREVIRERRTKSVRRTNFDNEFTGNGVQLPVES